MNPDWCFYPRSYPGGERWCFARSDLDLTTLLDRAATWHQSYEALFRRLNKRHGLMPKELLSGLGFLSWIVHESGWPKGVESEAVVKRRLEPLLFTVLSPTLERLELAARNWLADHKNRRTVVTEDDRTALRWLSLLSESHLQGRMSQVDPRQKAQRHRAQTRTASQMRSRDAQVRYETAVRVLESLGMKPTPALIARTTGMAAKTIRKYTRP